MKKQKTTYIKTVFIVFILMLSNLNAQTYNKPGTTSAAFLKLGVTARAESMGSSVVSDVSDASSAYYNPAGLLNVKNISSVINYTKMPASVNHSYLSIAKRLSDDDALALSVTSLRTDEMTERTIMRPEGTGRKFVYADYAFGLSYAHNFTMDLSIGFTVKYLWMNPMGSEINKSTWSADMGLQYKTPLTGILDGLRIGMMVSNFGPEVTVINQSFALPLKYTVGVSKPIQINDKHILNLAANWIKSLDEQEKAQMGLEYNFNQLIYLRGGYKFANEEKDLSGGFGIRYKIYQTIIKIDYCYQKFGKLGNLHQVTAGIDF